MRELVVVVSVFFQSVQSLCPLCTACSSTGSMVITFSGLEACKAPSCLFAVFVVFLVLWPRWPFTLLQFDPGDQRPLGVNTGEPRSAEITQNECPRGLNHRKQGNFPESRFLAQSSSLGFDSPFSTFSWEPRDTPQGSSDTGLPCDAFTWSWESWGGPQGPYGQVEPRKGFSISLDTFIVR